MLRITTHLDTTRIIFELEGRLAGLWVRELERCWHQLAVTDQPVRVVLRAVTFIDGDGRKLLAEMHRSGAELTAEGCMTRAIIEEISRGERT